MKKEDAKSLISDVYNNLLQHIEDHSEQVDEEILIDFLHDTANAIVKNDLNTPLTHSSQKLTFDEEYKQLAKQSLESYTQTNNKVAALTKEQQSTLDLLSLPNESMTAPEQIAQSLSSIQLQLNEEVTRANRTISHLVERVKELENKASIDPMTKVFNRRALESYLEKIVGINDHEIFMHVFMVDVDNFKAINDTHGHITGDKILIFLANLLKNTLRDGDKIFRYGGEEFVVVLNRINNEECILVAERILELVRMNKLLFKNKQIPVTLSIGATQYKVGDDMETLLERADKALYRAKRNGKDRLEVEN